MQQEAINSTRSGSGVNAPETPMQLLKGEIERANARLGSIRNDLETILGRFHGPNPPSGKDQAAEALRSAGLLPASRDELVLTHDLIGQINILMENLNGSI